MEEEKIVINQEKFEEQFSQKKVEKKVVVEEKKEKVSKPTSQLTGARQQNINIVLNKVKMEPIDVKNALLSYDLEKLSPTVCELIMYFVFKLKIGQYYLMKLRLVRLKALTEIKRNYQIVISSL